MSLAWLVRHAFQPARAPKISAGLIVVWQLSNEGRTCATQGAGVPRGTGDGGVLAWPASQFEQVGEA